MTTPAIRKAVFPVAGLGSRFLPATKAIPKEMLPILDKPLIQYAVEEALQAGMTQFIFITGYGKTAIENHFDTHFELEKRLEAREQWGQLQILREILPSHAECIYIRQREPLGLGHAILQAASVIGEEPFAVLLADDWIVASQGCLAQLQQVYMHQAGGRSVIAVQSIAPAEVERYGVVAGMPVDQIPSPITGIVEKPKSSEAPSQWGVVGRYLLTPSIFECLAQTFPGRLGEIQLTDAIAKLLKTETVWASPFTGKRYDCGNIVEYLLACVDCGLSHPTWGPRVQAALQERMGLIPG